MMIMMALINEQLEEKITFKKDAAQTESFAIKTLF